MLLGVKKKNPSLDLEVIEAPQGSWLSCTLALSKEKLENHSDRTIVVDGKAQPNYYYYGWVQGFREN